MHERLKIYTILLNWNGKNDTLECLASLAKIRTPFHTLVVDNGSTDGSPDAIRRQFPEVTLIETGKNLGYAGGNNVGIRRALQEGADAIFLLNNDTVVDPNILEAYASSLFKHPEAGILGAKLYLYSEPDRFDHLGGNWNRKKGVFNYVAWREKDSKKSAERLDYAAGAALFIKREVFEAIGLLEENFFLIWEEADFCFRARRAGFLSLLCPDAKVWHKVSASFVGKKPHSTYFWWRGRLLWIERNCKALEKTDLYMRVLIPEIFKLWKLKLLKSFQLYLLTFVGSHKDLSGKREKMMQYRAALQGVKDYALRRFDSGPAWIYGLGSKSPNCYNEN